MHLDQALHQRQPDAEPAVGARGAAIHLGEQVEHARQRIGGDADAGIADREHQDAVGARAGDVARRVADHDDVMSRHRSPDVGLGACAREGLRVLVEEPDRPRERVRGRVLAGEQHRQHVAVNLAGRDSRLRVVGGNDHRLEQVLRRGAARGILEALARRGDEALDCGSDYRDAAIELAIGRHLAQRPWGDVTDTRWRWSLMNWGHDPLRGRKSR